MGADLQMATARKRLGEELRAAGTAATDVWQLVDSRDSYPEAVPVLVRWLGLVDSEPMSARERRELLEGLARALTVREARPAAAGPLIDAFRRVAAEDQTVGWVIGNALNTVTDRTHVDEILRLVLDERYGSARQLLVASLARIGKGRSDIGSALQSVIRDENLTAFVIPVVAALDPELGRRVIPEFLDDPRPLVRSKAKAALRAIGRGDSD